MAKKHINIDDLNENTAQNLSEDVLRKVTGGALLDSSYTQKVNKANILNERYFTYSASDYFLKIG